VQTKDGYLLGLHRLGWKHGEEGQRINSGPSGLHKKVVYLHHGLLMNSEVWVCLTEKERCLPFALVEAGYDVWLGNNRGNKYSKKSIHHAPNSAKFWDFSMDEFAFHDIPDSIDYILSTTDQSSLSYIGFSQGTAQAFATLSIHPTLNDKVDVFVALAPAMAPSGLHNGIVDALVKASPEVLFLAFGRRNILSSATMWQQILYPPIFTRLIDASLTFLFNWTGRNISAAQKLAAYPHLYSFTSTKSVVHWFQIIRTASFQMYDDDVAAPVGIGAPRERYYKVAKFPTRNIKTPIVLVYGGSDSLVDIKVMLKELPRHTVAREIKHFEHLDFLWAQEVRDLVFPHVFSALGEHAGRDHTATLRLYHRAKVPRLTGGFAADESGEDSERDTVDTLDGDAAHSPVGKILASNGVQANETDATSLDEYAVTGPTLDGMRAPESKAGSGARKRIVSVASTASGRPGSSGSTAEARTSRREGKSPTHAHFADKGIEVGASRATVGGLVK
jgi:lysosomal acid lipase/cholesteryl ester hydrolase